MKVVGLITEYNPFHNGHKYHLEASKEKASATHSIAVMSGNFLQRGEPALLDKWTRAKMAVDSGVDLVLELPTVFATQSAEYFAHGAVSVLEGTNVVDSLCFGSELGDTELLKDIADVLVDEPLEFKNILKKHLNLGLSFPKARSLALKAFFEHAKYSHFEKIEKIVESPNNILGIEYMKSLIKLKSKITPLTIKRVYSNYHDKDINSSIASATSIREHYFKNKNIKELSSVVPPSTLLYMSNFLKQYSTFNHLDYFSDIFLYIFRFINYDKICFVNGMDEGIENRIKKIFDNSNDLDKILQDISTKRYPLTRIKRILIHGLLDLDKETFEKFKQSGPRYIRVLAVSKKGEELLTHINKKSKLPIITKFAGHEKFKDQSLNDMILFDKKATDIYFTGLSKFNENSNMNKDYTQSPYFSKK